MQRPPGLFCQAAELLVELVVALVEVFAELSEVCPGTLCGTMVDLADGGVGEGESLVYKFLDFVVLLAGAIVAEGDAVGEEFVGNEQEILFDGSEVHFAVFLK